MGEIAEMALKDNNSLDQEVEEDSNNNMNGDLKTKTFKLINLFRVSKSQIRLTKIKGHLVVDLAEIQLMTRP